MHCSCRPNKITAAQKVPVHLVVQHATRTEVVAPVLLMGLMGRGDRRGGRITAAGETGTARISLWLS